jgi:hypothetical protein
MTKYFIHTSSLGLTNIFSICNIFVKSAQATPIVFVKIAQNPQQIAN